MIAEWLVVKFLLPECRGQGNSIFMPFLWPILLDVSDAFTRVKEEGCGVDGNLVSQAVVFGEDKPSHIDGSNHLFIRVFARSIYLLKQC